MALPPVVLGPALLPPPIPIVAPAPLATQVVNVETPRSD